MLLYPLPLSTAGVSTAILPLQDISCCSPFLNCHRLHGIFGSPGSSRTRPASVVTVGAFRRWWYSSIFPFLPTRLPADDYTLTIGLCLLLTSQLRQEHRPLCSTASRLLFSRPRL